jgi:Domain of unknown function (DUF362)
MKKRCSQSRRSFLKASVASAAGIAVASGLTKSAIAREAAWTTGMRINPLIDNLKVVSCKDTTYLTKVPTSWGFSTVNSDVDSGRVAANMDAMAVALTGAATAAAAWAMIFQKPTTKATWSLVKVAFKVNCIEPNLMPKIAMINKVALELYKIGVPYANMIVYDGCNNASGKYNYTGSPLTAGIQVSNTNSLLNGTVNVTVPAPLNASVACTADIANGVIDIIVNFAVTKGHDSTYGGCTGAMKNHYGTFNPNSLHSYNGLIGANKSDALLGGTVCRQQLIVMDAIMGMTGGPNGTPDSSTKWPYRLLMGTFAPAVDYVTARKVRQAAPMNATPSTTVDDFLVQFGYTAAQVSAMVMTDVTPAPVTGVSVGAEVGNNDREIIFQVSGDVRNGAVKIPFSSEKVGEVSVYNIQGRLIRNFVPKSANAKAIAWDGKTQMGVTVNPGTYVISLRGGKTERTARMIVR